MKRLLALFAVLLLAGCATPTVSRVEQGDQVVGERMVVKLDGPWNRFDNFGGYPVPTWTMEGFTVDRLQFFIGVKDGATLVPQSDAAREKRPLTFRKSMQPHEIVALFQTLLSGDSSTFTLDKLPASARRLHPEWKDPQILSTYILDDVLKPRRPKDAAK